MAKSDRATDVASAPSFRKKAEATARDERAIQRIIDKTDEKAKEDKKEPKAMQAGARVYPVPPLPATASPEARPGGRARARADVRRARTTRARTSSRTRLR